MVGAILVQGGEVVAEGYHARVGGDHAEVAAIRAAGFRARGATLYVTLEPCVHHGRTPPCAEAVIAAGIRRVVACHRDPDPRVAGRGFARLRQAGLEVEVGVLAERAVRLNLIYLLPKIQGRPVVTLKWAMSLDGKIATAGGESRWISSPPGRRWGLALREEHDAILVGSGTALADDPRLTRRLGLAGGAITRVVLDRRLRLPPEARMLDEEGPVLVYTESSAAAPRRRLEDRGVTVVPLPRVEPPAVLEDLRRREVGSLLVEGGGQVLAAFAAEGCYDRVAVNLAPLLVGGRVAPGPLGGDGLGKLAGVPRLEELKIGRRGADLVLMGMRKGCLRDLLSNVAG